MPIRFRCAYCNQLLGIARRKAGTVVRCPNCSGQVMVPDPDARPDPSEQAVEIGEGAAQPPPRPAPLLERSEIDELLKPSPAAAPAPVPLVPVPTGAEPAAGPALHPAPQGLLVPPNPPGIWLSPSFATLLSVLGVLALALAFAIGLIVGRFVLPG